MTLAAPLPRGRPSWSGLLRISLVAVPVKAYPALSTTTSHFHQLHVECGQRIRHQKQCPRHGPVDDTAIVRGYAYAPDHHVVVEPDELNKLRPPRDKALLLEQFVTLQQIDPTFFAGRSLYLLPDSLAAQHPYSVLTQVMREGGKVALGRVVLSDQRHLVLVRPAGTLLVLHVLHYPTQLRAAAAWAADLAGSTAGAEELHLARQLLEAAGGPLDWSRYRDTTAEELAALVQAKLAQRPPAAPAQEPAALRQLLEALKQSVAALQPLPASAAVSGQARPARRARP